MFIADYMSSDPITIGAASLLSHAHDLMETHSIRHLPVLDESKRLVGIISDRDVRSAVGFEKALGEKLTASEIMVIEPHTVSADNTIDTALAIFARKRIGALPVLECKQLVGIITRSDVLRAFAQVMGLDKKGTQLEIALPDGCKDLAHVFEALREYNEAVVSAVVSHMRRDGGEPSLYLRVAVDDAAKLERLLRQAAVIVLKPEESPTRL